MRPSETSTWLNSIVAQEDGFETAAVEQFTDRLLRLAGSRLPARLQRRVGADDIVQSVFRSFFDRHRRGRFQFSEAPDVWRLLAAMTFRKVQRAIRFHGQLQRDYGRDSGELTDSRVTTDATSSSLVVMIDLLDSILDRIPPVHQSIVQMRLEGFSIEEIAARTGVSTRTVDRSLALVRHVAEELIDDE